MHCGAQVLERIKEPLQTLMSRDQYETAYAVLAHFLLLAQRAPSLFSQARCSRRCAPCRHSEACKDADSCAVDHYLDVVVPQAPPHWWC